jgi:putative membrane protein
METSMIHLHRILHRCGQLALAVGMLSIPLIAAENPFAYAANEAKTKSGTSMSEAATFAKKAAIGDMFEIESSKLAASKSASAEVKKFAQEMVTAHTQTTEEVKKLATAEGFAAELPKQMDSKHSKMLSELKGLSGTKFDRKYIELQVAAHKEAAELFDTYATQGKSPAFKQFAAQTAPIIKRHLDHAQTLGKTIPTS